MSVFSQPIKIEWLAVSMLLLFSNVQPAFPQAQNISSEETALFQRWMTTTGSCDYNVVYGSDQNKIRECLVRITSANKENINIIDKLTKIIYADIGSKLNKIYSFSSDVRRQILEHGISTGQHIDLSPVFKEKYNGISRDNYGKIVNYIFNSMIPIVSVTPTYTYGIAYYSPLLDMLYIIEAKPFGDSFIVNDGYWVLGSVIRRERESPLPPSLRSLDSFVEIPDITARTIKAVGIDDIYRANKKYSTSIDTQNIILARAIGFMQRFAKRSMCNTESVKKFNISIDNTIRSVKRTNIDVKTKEHGKGDFREIIYMRDVNENEVVYIASKSAPQKLVMLTTTASEERSCIIDMINAVDAFAAYKK